MNKLETDKRKAVIAALVEGNSINSTVRMTRVAKTTILRLLRDLGCACAAYHHEHVRGLKPASVQCDEVWSFIHCKAKNAPTTKRQQPGIDFGFLPAPLALVHKRDVVERGERVRMILAQHLGALVQAFEQQLLRLTVALLTPERDTQVVLSGERVGVVLAQRLAPTREPGAVEVHQIV